MSKLNMSSTPVANQVTVAVATMIGLGFAIYLGMVAGHQETTKIWLFFAAIAGIVVALILGDKYWLLLPLSMSVDVSTLPAVGGREVELVEMVSAGCTVLFVMRLAMKRERLELLRRDYLPVVAFLIWVIFTYSRNPVGLSVFGSQGAVGARAYVKIVLAFGAFVVLTNQRATEKDVKWLLGFFIVTPFLNVAASYLNPGGGLAMMQAGDPGYEAQSSLASPANMLFVLIFSRYTVSQVFSFSRPYLLPILLLALGTAMISGKRAVAFLALATPAITSLIRGRTAPALLWTFAFATFITFLVAGHGTWFQLPWSTQRVLMNLPGNWDSDLKNYSADGGDGFRAKLREIAWEKIQENPFLGRGIGVQMSEVMESVSSVGANVDAYYYAQGSAWHSMWLGLMVDFGVFSVIPFIFILIMVLRLCWQIYKSHPPSSHIAVYGMFCLIMTIQGIMRSYTSGNATGATMWWLTFGVLLAVRDGVVQTPAKTKAHQPALEGDILTPEAAEYIPKHRMVGPADKAGG